MAKTKIPQFKFEHKKGEQFHKALLKSKPLKVKATVLYKDGSTKEFIAVPVVDMPLKKPTKNLYKVKITFPKIGMRPENIGDTR